MLVPAASLDDIPTVTGGLDGTTTAPAAAASPAPAPVPSPSPAAPVQPPAVPSPAPAAATTLDGVALATGHLANCSVQLVGPTGEALKITSTDGNGRFTFDCGADCASLNAQLVLPATSQAAGCADSLTKLPPPFDVLAPVDGTVQPGDSPLALSPLTTLVAKASTQSAGTASEAKAAAPPPTNRKLLQTVPPAEEPRATPQPGAPLGLSPDFAITSSDGAASNSTVGTQNGDLLTEALAGDLLAYQLLSSNQVGGILSGGGRTLLRASQGVAWMQGQERKGQDVGRVLLRALPQYAVDLAAPACPAGAGVHGQHWRQPAGGPDRQQHDPRGGDERAARPAGARPACRCARQPCCAPRRGLVPTETAVALASCGWVVDLLPSADKSLPCAVCPLPTAGVPFDLVNATYVAQLLDRTRLQLGSVAAEGGAAAPASAAAPAAEQAAAGTISMFSTLMQQVRGGPCYRHFESALGLHCLLDQAPGPCSTAAAPGPPLPAQAKATAEESGMGEGPDKLVQALAKLAKVCQVGAGPGACVASSLRWPCCCTRGAPHAAALSPPTPPRLPPLALRPAGQRGPRGGQAGQRGGDGGCLERAVQHGGGPGPGSGHHAVRSTARRPSSYQSATE